MVTSQSCQRTDERAQLLAPMTHPSRVLNLDIKAKSFYAKELCLTADSTVSGPHQCSADINIYDINIYIYIFLLCPSVNFWHSF